MSRLSAIVRFELGRGDQARRFLGPRRPMSKPRIAVVSPFIDKRHGTERAVAECVQRLAGDYDIHVYSTRVEDLNFETITWHRIPALPGPHLFGYLWWFMANHLWRWWDQRIRGFKPAVVFSPGINCLDADVIMCTWSSRNCVNK